MIDLYLRVRKCRNKIYVDGFIYPPFHIYRRHLSQPVRKMCLLPNLQHIGDNILIYSATSLTTNSHPFHEEKIYSALEDSKIFSIQLKFCGLFILDFIKFIFFYFFNLAFRMELVFKQLHSIITYVGYMYLWLHESFTFFSSRVNVGRRGVRSQGSSVVTFLFEYVIHL